MKISVIIITCNRKAELKNAIYSFLKQNYDFTNLELIIVDNSSNEDVEKMLQEEFKENKNIIFYKLTKNLGVAGGRNFGIQRATGDILIFLDDDAEIDPIDALEKIEKKFIENTDIGILTFKIVNYFSNKIQREEFPHIDKSLDPDKEFETTYFVGAGHAIRKEVFEKCGLYPDNFFYSMEELDLSFRAINNGYKIIYFPEVIVWHKKSPKGRITDNRKWAFTLRNRMIISYKYLPYKDFLISSLLWFLKIAIKAKSLTPALIGLKEFLKEKKNLQRQTIKNETLQKIKKMKGRIWH